jgi:4-hydroxy-tetrahydrodipicolinate synthase
MMFDLTGARKLDQAMKLQYRLLELFDAMLYSADFPEGFRAAVELRGFAMGRGRQPLSAPQQVNREQLQKVLRCLLADFGYVDPPPEGCPPRRPDAKAAQVNQIVGEVVEALRHKGVL